MSTTLSAVFEPLTGSQQNRSADATIRGYLYQFERTIAQALGQGSDAVFRLEGIEDLDVLDDGCINAVQVKYHESLKTVTPKALAKPLYEMFESFRLDQKLTFTLYVYSPNGLKDFRKLTERGVEDAFSSESVKQKIGYSDRSLFAAFASAVRLVEGVEIGAQRDALAKQIAKALNCDLEEARGFHLPRAVHFVSRVACNKDSQKREISRRELIEEMHGKDFYYHKWMSDYISESRLIKLVSKQLKAASIFSEEQFPVVGIEVAADGIEAAIEIIQYLSAYYLRNGTQNTSPASIVVNELDKGVLDELKSELLKSTDINFNDGYAAFGFDLARFKEYPVVNTLGVALKKASFSVRLASLETYAAIGGEERKDLTRKVCWFMPKPDFDPGELLYEGLDLKVILKILKETK